MPDGLQKFESREDGFKFGLQGMPEIALKIDEVYAEAVLKSASSSLEFALTAVKQNFKRKSNRGADVV